MSDEPKTAPEQRSAPRSDPTSLRRIRHVENAVRRLVRDAKEVILRGRGGAAIANLETVEVFLDEVFETLARQKHEIDGLMSTIEAQGAKEKPRAEEPRAEEKS